MSRLNKLLETDNILQKLPTTTITIIQSGGYKNGSIDFQLLNGQTLSLKTLRYNLMNYLMVVDWFLSIQ